MTKTFKAPNKLNWSRQWFMTIPEDKRSTACEIQSIPAIKWRFAHDTTENLNHNASTKTVDEARPQCISTNDKVTLSRLSPLNCFARQTWKASVNAAPIEKYRIMLILSLPCPCEWFLWVYDDKSLRRKWQNTTKNTHDVRLQASGLRRFSAPSFESWILLCCAFLFWHVDV